MRRRERERIADLTRDLCADEAPDVAARLVVIWAREIPGLWGVAHVFRPHSGTDQSYECDVLISEHAWETASEEDRADTIAHELAHVVVWARDLKAPTHGAKWRRCFARLKASADGFDW